jgi:hypothetical protein
VPVAGSPTAAAAVPLLNVGAVLCAAVFHVEALAGVVGLHAEGITRSRHEEALVVAFGGGPLLNQGAIRGRYIAHVERFAAGHVQQPIRVLTLGHEFEALRRRAAANRLHRLGAIGQTRLGDAQAQP